KKPETPAVAAAAGVATVESPVSTETASPQAEASSPQKENLQAETSEENVPPGAETEAEVDLPGAEDPASFASFMMSIASNAASSLGMMEHPVTGKREV
ncbi:MAG: hypothetical protein ABR568_24105, partial [Pyrinomonadaceae bacterium]